jgi:YD repeat-containing protein
VASPAITVTLDTRGGAVTSPDARFRLDFPAGALNRTAAIVATAVRPETDGEGRITFVRFDLNAYALDAQGRPAERITRFALPYTLTVNLSGVFDQAGPDRHIRLKYLDEAQGEWVDLPLVAVDRENHRLVARIDHFSSFGAGVTNEFWKLLFNDAKVGLFSGGAVYNYPIEAPPGRGGLAPQVNLSYNSKRIDGIMNWVQSDWAGLGWSIDQVEITRKIKTGGSWGGCSLSGSMRGHKNEFTLLINGASYKLVPANGSQLAGRYYTEEESFLYIVRHNAQDGQASPSNYQGEWWEVRAPDGTTYRIGYTADAEQRISYVASYDSGQSLGCNFNSWELYAGPHTNASVAYRWRVDRVTDVWANQINFAYVEWSRGDCSNPNVDQASFLSTITYNGGASLITFVRGARGTGGDGGPPFNESWGGYGDTWVNPGCENFYQPDYLSSIQVWHAGVLLREYKLGYAFYGPYGGNWRADWQQRMLTSITQYGKGGVAGGNALPATVFGYAGGDLLNHEHYTESDSYRFIRLTSINNGYGGIISFSYATPNYGTADYYNYNVTAKTVNPGTGTPMTTVYTYYDTCYRKNADPDHWEYQKCELNRTNGGAMIGHSGVTETIKADDGLSNAAVVRHYFHNNAADGSNWQRAGREYKTEQYDGGNTTRLASTHTNHTWTQNGSAYFLYTEAVTQATYAGGASRSTLVTYTYQITTGNLLAQFEYGDTTITGDERSTRREYSVNNALNVWILNKVKQEFVYKGLTTTALMAQTRYTYDGLAYGAPPTKGALTRVERWDGGAWITPTRTAYDTWGNPTVITDALGRTTTATYDSAYHLYPVLITNTLGQATQMGYDWSLGVVTRTLDANGAVTTYAYDAFGRLLEMYRPGDAAGDPTVKYKYYDTGWPIWTNPLLIGVWRKPVSFNNTVQERHFYDGLGREIQTHSAITTTLSGYATPQDVVVSAFYNSIGQVSKQTAPYAVNAYVWNPAAPVNPYTTVGQSSAPSTTTTYDALGRLSVVRAPDGTTTRHYYGLDNDGSVGIPANELTGQWVHSTVDANNRAKHYVSDAYGRLVIVRDFTGTCYPGAGGCTPQTQ